MADLAKIATEVRRVKKAATNIGPAGLCYDWNLSLARRLKREGADVRFIFGKFRTDSGGLCPHYWCRVGDVVCDVTGSQFNASLDERWPLVFVGVSDRYVEEEDQTDRL